MSRTRWEYDLVEKPFYRQLKSKIWLWIEGDTDVPELTERRSFRDGLLNSGLKASLLTGHALPEMAT